MYNSHKRVDALKFQTVVLPNGMIGNVAGPYEGRKHDSFMLADSDLLQKLQQHVWFNLQPLCVYGDPAYPISVHSNDAQGRYNKVISSVIVSVEWLFGLVSNYFKFVNFKKMQRIGVSVAGKVYIVCSILPNAHTCLYGSLTSETFNLEPPHIPDYFH